MQAIDLSSLNAGDLVLTQEQADDTLQWFSDARTHVGRVRMRNEDAFLSRSECGLWLVADGLGGHSRGDKASQAIVAALKLFAPSETIEQDLINIDQALQQAHEQCREMFANKKVGSTVALLYARAGYAYLLWAGDSRIYLLRDQTLKQLTEDHSVAQEKVNKGELTPEEAQDHQSAHVLTRALGVHSNLSLQAACLKVQKGDRYLLCSDGAYLYANESEITVMLLEECLAMSSEAFIHQALNGGGRDNVTAIVLEVR